MEERTSDFKQILWLIKPVTIVKCENLENSGKIPSANITKEFKKLYTKMSNVLSHVFTF